MTTDIISKIYGTLPGYTTVSDKLDKVTQEIKRRQAAPNPNPAGRIISVARAALDEMLAAGEPLDGLNARIAAKDAEDQAAQRAYEALRQMSDLLTSQLKSLRNDPLVMSALNNSLTEVLDEIKALEPIAEITTDEAVVASRRVDDGHRFRELVATITDLRREQSRILTASGHDWTTKISIAAAIRNVEDVYDDWAVWLQFGVLWHRRSDEQLPLRAPWPTPLMSALSGDNFTLWALSTGADMWIPTPDEYATYAEELRAKSREPRTDDRSNDRWRDPGTLGTGTKTSRMKARRDMPLRAHVID